MPKELADSLRISSGLNKLTTLPDFNLAITPKWVCSPEPATPIIGFALNVTSRPFSRNTSRTMIRACNSLSAVCNGLFENFQSISNCSNTTASWPSSSSLALTPPTSLWPISATIPYLSRRSTACSNAVRTVPWVRCQYCSCNFWDTDNSFFVTVLDGVFTQNSSSVADVKMISTTSSAFTCGIPGKPCSLIKANNSART